MREERFDILNEGEIIYADVDLAWLERQTFVVHPITRRNLLSLFVGENTASDRDACFIERVI